TVRILSRMRLSFSRTNCCMMPEGTFSCFLGRETNMSASTKMLHRVMPTKAARQLSTWLMVVPMGTPKIDARENPANTQETTVARCSREEISGTNVMETEMRVPETMDRRILAAANKG